MTLEIQPRRALYVYLKNNRHATQLKKIRSINLCFSKNEFCHDLR